MRAALFAILSLLIAVPATAQYTPGQGGAGTTSAQDTTPAAGMKSDKDNPTAPAKKKKASSKKSGDEKTKAKKNRVPSSAAGLEAL